ncbi:MAG: aminotransferase class I/II-fold pyridoxal phosphate-dependent enzyme [Spirochaetaceae bacterium]
MHEIAEKLNGVLKDCIAERLLSSFGRRIYFPKGIVAQTAEAGKRASKYNATVGMAFEHGEPMLLPSLSGHIRGLTAAEAVAYAPTAGNPDLRAEWLVQMRAKNPSLGDASISNPIVTSGLTNAIAHLGDLFVDEDDTVVLPDLFWGNYRLIFQERNGARLRTFPFFEGAGLNVPGFARALRDAASSAAKVVTILNFPNNPTGYTPTITEMHGVVEALHSAAEQGASILVISDDAYFGLFYDEASARESLFAHAATLHENILAAKVDGATKEEYAWGLRVGFLTLGSTGLSREQYGALEEKIKGCIRSSISNSSNLSQSLLLKTLSGANHDSEKALAYDRLKRRFEAVRRLVDDSRRPDCLTPLPFNSGYFMTFACEGIDAEALRQALLDRGIGTIAVGSAYLRVAYATVEEEQLEAFFSELYETARTL